MENNSYKLIDSFITELENQTVSYKNYRKHGRTLLKYSVIQPDTVNFLEFIAFNPTDANKTGSFICDLADKHKIKITGKAEPFWVGPSVSGQPMFFRGMRLEKLLKWYEYYGFKIEGTKISREPKMKIIVKKTDEKTTVTTEDGKVISVWYKATIGDKNIAEIIKKMWPNAEVVEE